MGKSKYQSIIYSSVVALSLITAPIAAPLQTLANGDENQQTSYTAAQATAYITLLTHTSPTYVDEVNFASSIYEGLEPLEKSKVTSANVTKLNNHKAAVVLVEKIASMPTVAEIQATLTLEELNLLKEKVEVVRLAYTPLLATQKSYVANYSTLTAAEAAISAKQKQLDNAALLTKWNDAVSALPAYIGLTNVTVDEFMLENASKYNSDQLAAIKTARAEYASLTSTTKTYVNADDLAKLTSLEADVKVQTTLETNAIAKKVANFTDLVDGIDLTPTTFVKSVEDLVDVYGELEEAVLAKIGNATKVKIANYQAAAAVVEEINNAGDLDAIKGASSLEDLVSLEEPVKSARTNYTALLSAQKTYVQNLTTLTDLESAISAKRIAFNNVEALTGWVEAYAALPEVKVLEDLTLENFADKGYLQNDINAIVKARAEYQKLNPTLRGAVSATELAKLVELEAGVKQQAEIKAQFDIQQAAQEDLELEVSTWTGQVTALGNVIEFTNLEAFKAEGAVKYTTEQITAIENVRSNYDKLSDEAKAHDDVKGSLETLQAHETAVVKQKELELELAQSLEAELLEKINAFVEAVQAIDTTDAATYTSTIGEAATAYEQLNENEVDSIPVASKSAYDNHILAEVVTTLISGAGSVDAITDVNQTLEMATETLEGLEVPVKAARDAYNKLATATLKQLVANVNYSDLTALENAIKDKLAEIELAKEVKSFTDAVTDLPSDVATFEGITFKSLATEATKYDETESDEIGAARELYNELSTEAQAVQAVKDALTILEGHEDALATQQGLIDEITKYAVVKNEVETFLAAYGTLTAETGGVTFIDFSNTTVENYVPELIPADPNDPDSTETPATIIYTSEEIELINTAETKLTDLEKALTVDGVIDTALVTKYIEDNDTKNIVETVTNFANSLNAQNQLILDYNVAQVQAVIDAITALSAPELDTDKVNEAKEKFDKLGDKKSEVSLALQTKLTNYVAATAVVEGIEAISEDRIAKAVLESPAEGEEAISTIETEFGDVQTAYNALTITQKALISNGLLTLADLKQDIANKRFALETEVALKDWKAAYDNIDDITDISYDKATFIAESATRYDEDQLGFIDVARLAYDEISEKFVGQVDELELAHLEGLEANIKTLADYTKEQEDELNLALSEWTAALPAIKAITLKTFTSATDAYYTDSELEQIETARKAYDDLATYNKPEILTAITLTAEIPAEDLKFLTDLEASITTYEGLVVAAVAAAKENVNKFITDYLEKIGNDVATFVTEVEGVTTALEALTAEEQAVFKTSEDYTNQYAAYMNNLAAATAVQAIQAAGTVEAIEAVTTQIALNVIKPKVTAANAKFVELTDEQQQIVTNLSNIITVSDLKAAVDTKQTELNKKAAISDWTTAYGKLPALLDFSNTQPEDLETAIKYSQVEKDLIKKADDIFKGYTAEVQGYVPANEVSALDALKAAIIKQEELEQDFADAQAQKAIDVELAPWEALIFPTLIGFTENMTKEEFGNKTPYSEADVTVIENARTLFDGLSEEAKAQTNDDALVSLETDLALQITLQTKFDSAAAAEAELKAYNDFIDALTKLSPSAETYITDVEAMNRLYEGLSPANLAKVSNANKVNVTNHVAAAVIVEEINAVSDLDAIEALTTANDVFNVLINIEVTRANYNALTVAQRSLVKNYANLATAEAAAKAKRTALQNAAAFATWSTALKNLPEKIDLTGVTYQTVGDVAWYNTTELNAISGLRAIYNGYSTTVQGYVPVEELETLESYEAIVTEYTRLQSLASGSAAAQAALANWQAALTLLPVNVIDVAGLTVGNYSTWDKYDEPAQQAIAKATEELGKLTPEVKAYINPADLEKHANHVAAAKVLEDMRLKAENANADSQVPAIIDAINALVKTDADYVTKTKAVGNQFDALSVLAKSKITATVTTKLTNHRAAVAIIESITALPTVETINNSTTVEQVNGYKDQVTLVRTAYTKLLAAQKTFVTNLATLTEIEVALTTKLIALQNAKALENWNTELGKIPVLPTPLTSTMTVEAYLGATKYVQADLDAIKAARAEYTNLTSTEKRAISAVDLKKLTDAEAQVKIQTTLDGNVATSKATEFTTRVNAISLTDTANFFDTVTAMYSDYTDLSDVIKSKLGNATKAKIENLNKAAVVVNKINDLDTSASTYKQDVVDARNTYTALLAASKSMVKNLTLLTQHEAAVKLLP